MAHFVSAASLIMTHFLSLTHTHTCIYIHNECPQYPSGILGYSLGKWRPAHSGGVRSCKTHTGLVAYLSRLNKHHSEADEVNLLSHTSEYCWEDCFALNYFSKDIWNSKPQHKQHIVECYLEYQEYNVWHTNSTYFLKISLFTKLCITIISAVQLRIKESWKLELLQQPSSCVLELRRLSPQ